MLFNPKSIEESSKLVSNKKSITFAAQLFKIVIFFPRGITEKLVEFEEDPRIKMIQAERKEAREAQVKQVQKERSALRMGAINKLSTPSSSSSSSTAISFNANNPDSRPTKPDIKKKKLIDFDKIHEKQFEQMESIVDMEARKRAITPTKPAPPRFPNRHKTHVRFDQEIPHFCRKIPSPSIQHRS